MDKKQYAKEYWQNNKDRINANRIALRLEVQQIKENTPCADCLNRFPYYVLHFDHLPQFKKNKEVAKLLQGTSSRKTVMAEIAKCEVVCANCHAVRTHNRGYAIIG